MSPQRLISIIITIYLLAFLNTATAQTSYSISKDTVEVLSDNGKIEVIADASIENLANRPIQIVWERVENQYPSQWLGTKICDINKCYPSNVSSKSFQLDSNQTGKLNVYFMNDNNLGNAYVKIKIFEPNDSAATTEFMHFYAKQPTSSNDINSPGLSGSIQIYPNPVNDYLNIANKSQKGIRKIVAYNILGTKVHTHRAESQADLNRINMQDLEKGIYMIRVFDTNNNVLTTESVSKTNH